MSQYHDGVRHGAHCYVELGRELNQAERCLRTIGATAAVTQIDATISANELVKAPRRATRAAETLRYLMEQGKPERDS